MVATGANLPEDFGRWCRLAKYVAPPAVDRVITSDTACVRPTCTDLLKCADLCAGLILDVSPPTRELVVFSENTAVLNARTDRSEHALGRRCRSVFIASPADHGSAYAKTASVRIARAYLFENAGLWASGLAEEVVAPTSDCAVG